MIWAHRVPTISELWTSLRPIDRDKSGGLNLKKIHHVPTLVDPHSSVLDIAYTRNYDEHRTHSSL